MLLRRTRDCRSFKLGFIAEIKLVMVIVVVMVAVVYGSWGGGTATADHGMLIHGGAYSGGGR